MVADEIGRIGQHEIDAARGHVGHDIDAVAAGDAVEHLGSKRRFICASRLSLMARSEKRMAALNLGVSRSKARMSVPRAARLVGLSRYSLASRSMREEGLSMASMSGVGDGICDLVMAFSFPWLLSMARKRPGRYDAGVNGLHGRSVRAPVDDGGRPGKLSRKVTTTKERNEKSRRSVRGRTSALLRAADGLRDLQKSDNWRACDR